MRHQMIILTIFCIIISAGSAMAADLHGTIYDISLNELSDVIVEVDSEPAQRYVSKDGMYRFSLNPGDYTITAMYQTERLEQLKTSEQISIIEEGDYVFDLFLFPSLDEEEDILTGTDLIDLEDSEVNGHKDYTWLYITIIAVIIILIIAYFIFRHRRDQEIAEELRETKKVVRQTKKMLREQESPHSAPKAHAHAHDNIQDADLKMVIDILKKEGGRTTQKELRKQIPLSEAKISLMITELQHKRIVKKVKKGRGNILILTK